VISSFILQEVSLKAQNYIFIGKLSFLFAPRPARPAAGSNLHYSYLPFQPITTGATGRVHPEPLILKNVPARGQAHGSRQGNEEAVSALQQAPPRPELHGPC
jgi:hypothetical protein